MTEDNKNLDFTLMNAAVAFAALKKPYAGKYGEKYILSLEFDSTDDKDPNLEIIKKLAKMLTKGGPIDIKDEDKIRSTGKLGLNFNSDTPIIVVDSNGELIPQELLPNLGKGTKVNVQLRVANTKQGVFKYIKGVQLVDVVEYVPTRQTVTFDKVAGGFSIADARDKHDLKQNTVADFDAVFGDKK